MVGGDGRRHADEEGIQAPRPRETVSWRRISRRAAGERSASEGWDGEAVDNWLGCSGCSGRRAGALWTA